jgi:hypothetical protein
MENQAKTNTTGAKPTQLHPTKMGRPPTKVGEKMSWVLCEEQTRTLQWRWRRQLSRRAAPHDTDDQDQEPRRPHDTRSRYTQHWEPPRPPLQHPTVLRTTPGRPLTPPSGIVIPTYHRSNWIARSLTTAPLAR